MNILGIIFALLAGVFFGIIGPITKTAYNLGAGIGLAIFLRYIVALIIVSPLIPNQQKLFSKCGWSPFAGEEFSHRIDRTIVSGKTAYSSFGIQENCRGMAVEFSKERR